MDPADMHSRSRPSCAVVRPNASRTAGVREANEANAMPLVANVTTTAVRARNRPWSARTVATKGSNRIDSMPVEGT